MVADEVRKLAESSTVQAKVSQRALKEILQATTTVASGTLFILGEMMALTRISHEVHSSMVEIGQGAQEITLAINTISNLSVENRDAIEDVNALTRRFKLA